ncbi:uncharacterized protein LOC129588447 [Paramacrobiotus metropolitanus]|uniref:uncharacterized protein LOC129588447 n=1 Tax=Paramacrobiotus metropolitanus TaxID=2943436 RepID=UPI0024456DF0|nr:uncharacterized protein LOC129588447 [Paramacrobiotus metropolitanus]
MASQEFNANCTRCQHNKLPCYIHLLEAAVDPGDPDERIVILNTAATAGNVSAYMEITRPEYWESAFNSPAIRRTIQRKRCDFMKEKREGWENPMALPVASDQPEHSRSDHVFGSDPLEFAASMFRHAAMQKKEMKEQIKNLHYQQLNGHDDVIVLNGDAEMDNGAVHANGHGTTGNCVEQHSIASTMELNSKLRHDLTSAQSEISELKESLAAAEKKVEPLNQQIQELQQANLQLEQQHNDLKEQMDERNVARYTAENDALKRQLAEADTKLKNETDKMREMYSTQIRELNRHINTKTSEIASLESTVKRRDAKILELDTRTSRALREKKNSVRNLSEKTAEVTRLTEEMGRLQDGLIQKNEEILGLQALTQQQHPELDAPNAESHDARKRQMADANAKLKMLRETYAKQLKDRIDDLRKLIAMKNSDMASLQSLIQEKNAEIADLRSALLPDAEKVGIQEGLNAQLLARTTELSKELEINVGLKKHVHAIEGKYKAEVKKLEATSREQDRLTAEITKLKKELLQKNAGQEERIVLPGGPDVQNAASEPAPVPAVLTSNSVPCSSASASHVPPAVNDNFVPAEAVSPSKASALERLGEVFGTTQTETPQHFAFGFQDPNSNKSVNLQNPSQPSISHPTSGISATPGLWQIRRDGSIAFDAPPFPRSINFTGSPLRPTINSDINSTPGTFRVPLFGAAKSDTAVGSAIVTQPFALSTSGISDPAPEIVNVITVDAESPPKPFFMNTNFSGVTLPRQEHADSGRKRDAPVESKPAKKRCRKETDSPVEVPLPWPSTATPERADSVVAASFGVSASSSASEEITDVVLNFDTIADPVPATADVAASSGEIPLQTLSKEITGDSLSSANNVSAHTPELAAIASAPEAPHSAAVENVSVGTVSVDKPITAQQILSNDVPMVNNNDSRENATESAVPENRNDVTVSAVCSDDNVISPTSLNPCETVVVKSEIAAQPETSRGIFSDIQMTRFGASIPEQATPPAQSPQGAPRFQLVNQIPSPTPRPATPRNPFEATGPRPPRASPGLLGCRPRPPGNPLEHDWNDTYGMSPVYSPRYPSPPRYPYPGRAGRGPRPRRTLA